MIVGHLGMKNVCKHFSELVSGNKISAVLVSAILLSGLFLGPNLFTEVEAGVSSSSGGASFTPCLSEEVTHFDKIIFHSEGAALRDNFGTFIGAFTPLDIKVLDDPTGVANLKTKVANFLNGIGWTNAGFGPVNPKRIVIDDVDYAIECIKLPSLQIWSVKTICGVLNPFEMRFGYFNTIINVHNPTDIVTPVTYTIGGTTITENLNPGAYQNS